VLRFDYDGTGDAAGDHRDPDRLRGWIDSIDEACRYVLAHANARELTLLGLRFGASLAALHACHHALPAVRQLILWDPVVQGRRFVRGLSLIAASPPADHEGWQCDASVSVAGTVHGADTLAAMAGVDLLTQEAPPVRRILVLRRPEREEAGALAERWLAQGAAVECLSVDGTAELIERAAEEAQAPAGIFQVLCDWLARTPPAPAVTGNAHVPAAAPHDRSRLEWHGVRLDESFVRVGPDELHGVLCQAAGDPPRGRLVVFLNSGTEHHVGPGRLWVEFSRALAAGGVPALRVDFQGVGESRLREPLRRVRPYDLQQIIEVERIVAFARARGFGKVVLLGLCASAWIALHAAELAGAAAVVAINPQLYWQPGDPTPIELSKFRKPGSARREAVGAHWRVWSLLDAIGVRPRAARLLANLRRQGIGVCLLFAEADPGIVYLRTRMGRRLRLLLGIGGVQLREIEAMDHPMHRHWLRPRALEVIERFVLGI
jgi:pimeloyl-ACP methyl ester carboxylesterase